MKPNRKRLDINALKQPETSERFSNAVNEKLVDLNINTTNSEMNNNLICSINSSAEETLQVQPRTRLYQPWHDDDTLRHLYDQKDHLIAQNADIKQLSSIRKRIRLRAKYLKNEYFKTEAEKINQFTINRELEKLFYRAKKQEITLKAAPGKCPPEKVLKHFQKHFNPDPPEVVPEELTNQIPVFVNQLRNISMRNPIAHKKPSIEEI